MYRIIGGRGTGKTYRLMLLAKEKDIAIVCSNPQAMRTKAHSYGITGLDFISYYDFNENDFKSCHKDFLIDELESFIKFKYSNNIIGYSMSNED